MGSSVVVTVAVLDLSLETILIGEIIDGSDVATWFL
jgi:hypothetical protein